MKSKRIGLIAVAVALSGLGLWWFMGPPSSPPSVPVQMVNREPEPPSHPATAAPIAPPAPKPVDAPGKGTVAALATPLPDPAADPQAELKTAFADIACLYRANDLLLFWQTYTTPEQWAKTGTVMTQRILQVQANTAENPGMQAELQKMSEVFAQGYDALTSQTPTFNDAGDEATYSLVLDFGGGRVSTEPWTFVKINGKWYLKPGAENQ